MDRCHLGPRFLLGRTQKQEETDSDGHSTARERPNSPRPPRPAHRLKGATTRWSVRASAGYIGAGGRSNHHRKWRQHRVRVRGDTRPGVVPEKGHISPSMAHARQGHFTGSALAHPAAPDKVFFEILLGERERSGEKVGKGDFSAQKDQYHSRRMHPQEKMHRVPLLAESFRRTTDEMAVDQTPSQCVS